MGYRANVLVVDDEEIVCKSCRRILASEGHNVQTALNGREALRKVEEDKYDVLIADWKMPEIDGMEVLRIVKKNHPEIIAIMMTGYPSVESAVKAMRLGVANYVAKPIDPDGLSQTLQKALQERKSTRDDLFYYQKYIWARLLQDGTVEVGVNEKLRQDVGDVIYVDLPCHRTRSEHGRLFIRALAADKQMHKLCVPIRGKVVAINHEINFNTDLINKDPLGRGWILRIEPTDLQEDLKEWSGNVSVSSDPHETQTGSLNRVATPDTKTVELTRTEIKTKPEAEPAAVAEIEEPASGMDRTVHASGATAGKFFLSALASRLFFVSLLPICVGAILKALYLKVSPEGAN
jgi:CheY-like chemotaxis protein/glycine cleavage system H lipoate-binding protein